MLIGVGGQTWGNKVIGRDLGVVCKRREESDMIAVGVAVELAADVVAVSFGQGIEAHCPIIHSRCWRNMPDNVDKLAGLFRSLKLALDPFEHLSGISWVSQVVPVIVILGLSVD